VDQVEALAIVLQVTSHAIFPIRILHLNPKVIAVLVREDFRNFFVALEALEDGGARTEEVTGIALGSSGEGGMRFR